MGETDGKAIAAAGRRLFGLAAASAAVYVAIALLWPERSHRTLREAAAWIAVGTVFALFLLGLRSAARTSLRVCLLAAALPLAAATFPAAIHSSDVEAYVTVGRIQSRYGLDPYAHTADEIPDAVEDPLVFGQWLDRPCVYGPLFSLYARAVAAASGENAKLAIGLFKIGNVLALALAAWILIRLGRGPPALWFLLAAPVVLLHVVVDAHNDALVGLFLLGTLAAARTGRWPLVLPALAAAALVKVAVVVVAPFALLFLWRRHGAARTAISAALALALAAAASAPYLPHAGEWRLGEIVEILSTPANSIQAALYYLWKPISRAVPALGGTLEPFRQGMGLVFAAGFLGFLTWRFLRSARRAGYDASALTEDAVLVTVALLCVASAKFYGWYLVTWIPSALLLPPSHPLRRLTERLAGTVLLAFTFVGRTRILDSVAMLSPLATLRWWRR